MQLHTEEVSGIRVRRRQINQTELTDIQFFHQGKPVRLPENIAEWWKFTGLSNFDFLDCVQIREDESGFYFFVENADA